MLQSRGLVHTADDVTDNRKRPISMTADGKALHDQIYTIAKRRVRLLMKGFSPQETELLLTMFRRMGVNLTQVNVYDADLISVARSLRRSRDENTVLQTTE
jgi:DNA-binding MarR family transcriptional regulator